MEHQYSRSLLDQLNGLRRFGGSLAECSSIEQVFEEACHEIKGRLNPQLTSLFMFSKDICIERRETLGIDRYGREITTENWSIPNEKYQPGESFSGKTIISSVVDEGSEKVKSYGESHYANNLDKQVDALKFGAEYVERLGFLRCGVSVPLNGMHKTFGTLEVVNRISSESGFPEKDLLYTEEDAYWLTILGAHVANAITKLRDKWEESILSEISRRLANPENEEFIVQSVYESIARKLVGEYMPYKACIIRRTFDDQNLEVDAKKCTEDISWRKRLDQTRSKDTQTFVGRVFTTGHYEVEEDIEANLGMFKNQDWIKEHGFKSYICFPLSIQGKIIGTISLFAAYKHRFSENDISLLRNISFLLASFKVLDELSKEKKERQRLVMACLKDPRYDFRTVSGISRETGIPESDVKTILEHADFSRKSMVQDRYGNDIYAYSGKSPSLKEMLAIIRRVLGRHYERYKSS